MKNDIFYILGRLEIAIRFENKERALELLQQLNKIAEQKIKSF